MLKEQILKIRIRGLRGFVIHPSKKQKNKRVWYYM